MPCWGVIEEKLDYRRLAGCRSQVSKEMLAQGWHTYDGKFNQVLQHRANLRYRGVK